MPAWLDRIGKACWREFAPMLADMGVLTKADRQAFARFCDLYSKWRQMGAVLDENGQTMKVCTKAGVVLRKRPEAALYLALSAELLKVEREFGLTPASRSRVNVDRSERPRHDKSRFFKAAPGA